MSNKEKIQQMGIGITRYSVVLILFWFGLSKFTPTEAGHIVELIKGNPLMSWLYSILSVQGVSNFIGVVEVSSAILIAIRPFSPKLTLWGSILGAFSFLITVSFMFTAGSIDVVDGLPVLGGIGGFVVKDLVMLGFCIWSAGEAWAAISAKRTGEKVSSQLSQKSITV